LGRRLGIQAFFSAEQGKSAKFPSFQPAIMLSGAMQVVAGTIPDGYKWLAACWASGEYDEGMQQLGAFSVGW